MIKKEELHIGAVVSVDGVRMPIISLLQTDAILKQKPGFNAYYRYELLEGVPLTEDVLKAAGFIDNERHEHPGFDELIHKDFNEFGIGNFNGLYWIVDGLDQWSGPIKYQEFHHLHQIQALFLAITGQPLTITL